MLVTTGVSVDIVVACRVGIFAARIFNLSFSKLRRRPANDKIERMNQMNIYKPNFIEDVDVEGFDLLSSREGGHWKSAVLSRRRRYDESDGICNLNRQKYGCIRQTTLLKARNRLRSIDITTLSAEEALAWIHDSQSMEGMELQSYYQYAIFDYFTEKCSARSA